MAALAMPNDLPTAASIANLLDALTQMPEDERVRERAAMALTVAGRHAEAVELLGALVNLTAHDGPTLPCLCRRCLQPTVVEAEADGMSFVRRFAVGSGRVLYFWAPEEIADDPGMLHAVHARMVARLGSKPNHNRGAA